ncbi:hypothetical protein J437_LFUL006053 [Ladona fulva]|uniref:Ig-like domain-containing protein n=1 Tax=Ladona fulva TaxID=123851 RepID=A0A8K0K450_LADFU|nr:hypothetical protein J437_LFUL006053 [Ladona fulva]
MLRGVTRWASGEYTCEAGNGEGIAKSEPLRLRIQYKNPFGIFKTEFDFEAAQMELNYLDAPRCRPQPEVPVVPSANAPGTSRRLGALRHETLRIQCDVDADPSTGVRFSWTYNISREVLHVPASRIISDGPLTSSLNYTPTSEADFGTLACWASNAIGRQKEPCLFHVVPASEYQYHLKHLIL